MAQSTKPNPRSPRPRWGWLKPSSRTAVRRRQLGRVLSDIRLFSRHILRRPLRPYQLEPALAIIHSVLHHHGLTFVVMMSRQAGKNELSAQLEAFLLLRFQRAQFATIIKTAPTYNPQLITSIERLEHVLDNPLCRGRWKRTLGTIQLRNSRARFLSGARGSSVVGATASLLLEVDEAQFFDEDKYLRDFRPMGASTNATTVLYGTAWTSDSLLEHVLLENRRLEALDGIQRNFVYPWTAVVEHNPEYWDFVHKERLLMGDDHPLFRTQYALESLTATGRLFSETQLAQMQLPAPNQVAPVASTHDQVAPVASTHDQVADAASTHHQVATQGVRGAYGSPTPMASTHDQSGASAQIPAEAALDDGSAVPTSSLFTLNSELPKAFPLTSRVSGPFLVAGIDLAGEDEEAEDALLRSRRPQRDSTAVTIAQVTWETTLNVTEPRIQVVHHYWWTGRKHSDLLALLVDLLTNVWRCESIVVDATGIGAGIASFLVESLGADRAHKFLFTAESKGVLGYQLLSAVNSGRLKVPTIAELLRGPPVLAEDTRPSSSGGLGGLPPREISYSPSPAHGGGGTGGEGAALNEFWHQARLARSTLHVNKRLSWYVDPREGHDDLLVSLALAVQAAEFSRPRAAVGRLAHGAGRSAWPGYRS